MKCNQKENKTKMVFKIKARSVVNIEIKIQMQANE